MKKTVILTFIILSMLVALVSLSAGRAQTVRQAGIVIQFGDDTIATRCVTFNRDDYSGYDMLQAAGFLVVPDYQANGVAICKIGPDGCETSDCLICDPNYKYWSYWHLQVDPTEAPRWAYSAQGSSSSIVMNGSVDGWRWGNGLPPSTVIPFEQVCAPTPTPTNTATATNTVTPTATATATSTFTHTPPSYYNPPSYYIPTSVNTNTPDPPMTTPTATNPSASHTSTATSTPTPSNTPQPSPTTQMVARITPATSTPASTMTSTPAATATTQIIDTSTPAESTISSGISSSTTVIIEQSLLSNTAQPEKTRKSNLRIQKTRQYLATQTSSAYLVKASPGSGISRSYQSAYLEEGNLQAEQVSNKTALAAWLGFLGIGYLFFIGMIVLLVTALILVFRSKQR